MNKKERYQRFIDYFSGHQPTAATELHFNSPFELLVAVVLSAQCTDKRVNLTTPGLFRKFPDAQTMATASIEEVFQLIKSVSFPNNKSKYLVQMSKMLVEQFNGRVPDDIQLLEQLPGVGRKTANVVAAVVYDIPTMPVDTHVFRVSARLGLTTGARTPLDAEKQLLAHIPPDKLNLSHHWLLLHGRYVCLARKPKCDNCSLKVFCRYYQNVQKAPL